MTISLYPPIGSSVNNAVTVQYGGSTLDAFGRLRVSQPYTLFDSENRYAPDSGIDTSTVTGGSTTYLPNESTVRMDVTTASGAEVVRQTFRRFAYQPGKGLLSLQTFTMNASKAGLRQRLGYFGTQNGAFFQQDEAGILSFTIRSYTSGAVDDTRKIPQSSWNGDKLNGSGTSGITLDVTKTQILWFDFEWLGVGNVRCGFVINGVFIICHTFYNANFNTSVYMTTAQLPMRWEITNTASTASVSSMKQICCSVMSEGGYEQVSIEQTARRATKLTTIGNTFLPLISIRLNASKQEAIILPNRVVVLPTTSQNYEVVLVKNSTLTGASWVTGTFANVDYDVTATAMTTTATSILQNNYMVATSQAVTPSNTLQLYNWDLQLGASLAGVSDIYTIGIRTLDPTPTGDAFGSLTFYDLTI